MEAESENARVFEISAHVKDPQAVQINLEPSTTARLIACVLRRRVKHYNKKRNTKYSSSRGAEFFICALAFPIPSSPA